MFSLSWLHFLLFISFQYPCYYLKHNIVLNPWLISYTNSPTIIFLCLLSVYTQHWTTHFASVLFHFVPKAVWNKGCLFQIILYWFQLDSGILVSFYSRIYEHLRYRKKHLNSASHNTKARCLQSPC